MMIVHARRVWLEMLRDSLTKTNEQKLTERLEFWPNFGHVTVWQSYFVSVALVGVMPRWLWLVRAKLPIDTAKITIVLSTITSWHLRCQRTDKSAKCVKNQIMPIRSRVSGESEKCRYTILHVIGNWFNITLDTIFTHTHCCSSAIVALYF